MPANLTPEYLSAEKRFKEAKTTDDKIMSLEEMISALPKHKGTDHLFGDLKRKLSKLKDLKEAGKKSSGRKEHWQVKKEGADVKKIKITHGRQKTGMIKYYLGRIWMWIFGYEVTGSLPPVNKCIFIGAPHTTNWDLPFGLALLYIFRIRFFWMGKHTLFKGPLGWLMKALGGIPINRKKAYGVVHQFVDIFNESEYFALIIAPEGTRKKRDHWKSGFYRIAVKAQVPFVCGYVDYQKKKAGLGLSFVPTGNAKEDMDKIRDFYKNIHGKHPERNSLIRLKDES